MDGSAIIGVLVAVGLVAYFIDKYQNENSKVDYRLPNQNVQTVTPVPHTSVPEMKLYGPWDALREKVLARDSNKCVMCSATSNLQVDHIQELSLGGTNAMSNLRTLCVNCHEERHGRNFTRKEYYTDRRYGENYQLNPKVASLKNAGKLGVGIKYTDRSSRYSERVIYPNRIWSDPETQRVYVKAYDELDGDTRVFKLSRMKICGSRLNFYAVWRRLSELV